MALALLSTALLGCPSKPTELAYDLARRLPVAERLSKREVILFGTPGIEPYLADGFYREAAPPSGDGFVWARQEAELSLHFADVQPRAGVVDLAPFRGVKGQAVEVSLGTQSIGRFTLNDDRHRYRLSLPPAAQRVGENRLRFAFAASASPSADKANPDKRQLAAAFYSLTLGSATDPIFDDLLQRDAPPPFGVLSAPDAAPALVQMGPSTIRYAVRLPARAELRFTPDLHVAARAAAASARLSVSIEARPGQEREIWAATLDPQARSSMKEQVVGLPGAAGDIVRIGLHVAGERFAWGLWRAPRVMGQGVGAGLETVPRSEVEEKRGAALRQSTAGFNVVLVILDAGRARSFGCYGSARPTTPQIDRIAAESVVFDRAYTPAVYTLGAMASVWTSQYPDRHHSEISYSARLPKDRLTLAELLSAQGIHTAGFVANAVAGKGFGFDRGFKEFEEVFLTLGSRGDVFAKVLPAWFHAHKAQPFFAYVHFREPHFPYDPIPPFDTRFGPDGPISKTARADMAFFTDVNQGRRPFSEAEVQHLGRLFDGNLAFADQEVGKIRAALEAEGLWDRTVVIVAADHGEALFEHDWVGHNTQLYEESTQVPLIVHVPNTPAARLTGLVDLLDLAPTIADVFGALGKGGSDKKFQGQSLLPVMAGAAGKGAVLSRTVWDRPRYALRDERRKLIYLTRTGEEELYDLIQDPQERSNLVTQEPILAAYYRQALQQRIGALAGTASQGPDELPSCEQCENLKALGYLDSKTACPCH